MEAAAEPDFSIEGENQAPVERPAVTPPPRVVIEYRERGFSSLLVPPLLILLGASIVAGTGLFIVEAEKWLAGRFD